MDFSIEQLDNNIIIAGQIDSVNSESFEQLLRNAVDQTEGEFAIVCTDLEYISSSGLRVFIALQKRCNAQNKPMKITNLPAHIHEIFDMTGFSKIISIQ